MPTFTFKLPLFLDLWLQILRTRLQQEAHLSAHAEVRHNQDGQFAEERVSTQLQLITRLMQKLFHRDGLNLHDVANIQIEDPLVLIEEAQDTSHVRLLFFHVILVVHALLRRVLIAHILE